MDSPVFYITISFLTSLLGLVAFHLSFNMFGVSQEALLPLCMALSLQACLLFGLWENGTLRRNDAVPSFRLV